MPSSGQEFLIQRLAYINEQEDLDVLIPNFDAELFSFIKLADRLEKEMGIKVVTVYADDDKALPHALFADESYPLGSGALADTYLNKNKLYKYI